MKLKNTTAKDVESGKTYDIQYPWMDKDPEIGDIIPYINVEDQTVVECCIEKINEDGSFLIKSLMINKGYTEALKNMIENFPSLWLDNDL